MNSNALERFSRIPWTSIGRNAGKPRGMNSGEDCLIDSFTTQGLNYVGYVKQHSGLERMVIDSVVSPRMGRDPPQWKWTQVIKETLDMKVYEAGLVAISRELFGSDVP